MPNTNLPAGVVVSMDAPWPVSTLKPMLRVLSSNTSIDIEEDQESVLCSLRMRPVIGVEIARRYASATSAARTGVKPVK
jgi:hypothetical protein